MGKVRLGDKEFELTAMVICPLSGRPLLKPDSGGEDLFTARAVTFWELAAPGKKRAGAVSSDELVFIDPDMVR